VAGYQKNYLAAARVLPWLFSRLDAVAPDLTFEEPINHPQKHWTANEYRMWLAIRGLPTTGPAAELRARVKDHMASPSATRLLMTLNDGGTVRNITDMVVALHSMIATIMVTSVEAETITEVRRRIQVFLNAFHTFDKAIRSDKEKPTWITSYNFMCLMNIPDNMEKFGPMRNLWEGGGQGEKIIGTLKPLWYAFRKNWHINLLNNTLKGWAIERVQQSGISTTSHQDCQSERKETQVSMVHKYQTMTQVNSHFENKNPCPSYNYRMDDLGAY